MKGYILSKQFYSMVGLKHQNKGWEVILLFSASALSNFLGLFLSDATGITTFLTLGITFTVIFGFLGCATIFAFVTVPNRRHWQPNTPDRSVLVRVLKNEQSGEEMFLYGTHKETPREILKRDWPFDDAMKGMEWEIYDENDNAVTDSPLTDFEGTICIRFLEVELTHEC